MWGKCHLIWLFAAPPMCSSFSLYLVQSLMEDRAGDVPCASQYFCFPVSRGDLGRILFSSKIRIHYIFLLSYHPGPKMKDTCFVFSLWWLNNSIYQVLKFLPLFLLFYNYFVLPGAGICLLNYLYRFIFIYYICLIIVQWVDCLADMREAFGPMWYRQPDVLAHSWQPALERAVQAGRGEARCCPCLCGSASVTCSGTCW